MDWERRTDEEEEEEEEEEDDDDDEKPRLHSSEIENGRRSLLVASLSLSLSLSLPLRPSEVVSQNLNLTPQSALGRTGSGAVKTSVMGVSPAVRTTEPSRRGG